MLCSVCKKNPAVIFINKTGSDNKSEMEGLCYSCATKKGINPLDNLAKQANLSEKDIADMTNKIESMLSGLSANIDEEQLNEMAEEVGMDPDEIDEEILSINEMIAVKV